jgi:hypothetical protein
MTYLEVFQAETKTSQNLLACEIIHVRQFNGHRPTWVSGGVAKRASAAISAMLEARRRLHVKPLLLNPTLVTAPRLDAEASQSRIFTFLPPSDVLFFGTSLLPGCATRRWNAGKT